MVIWYWYSITVLIFLQLLDSTISYLIYDVNFTKITRSFYYLFLFMFCHTLPISYRGKNFRTRKTTKFWRGGENFSRQKIFTRQTFPDKVIFFTKICCDVVKNKHCYQFLCKGLKGFPRKAFPRISWIWLSLVKLHSLKIFWKWLKQER